MTEEALNGLVFAPSKKVVYAPNDKVQIVDLMLKSTRPSLYKMRPVFSFLAPKEKKPVKLMYRGMKDKTLVKVPLKDRFTVEYMIGPADVVQKTCSKQWRSQKEQSKTKPDGGARKKSLKILYAGINDNEKDDDEKEQTPAKPPTESPEVTKKKSAAAVMVRARQVAPNEDTRSDDDYDDSDAESVEKRKKQAQAPPQSIVAMSVMPGTLAPTSFAKDVKLELPQGQSNMLSAKSVAPTTHKI